MEIVILILVLSGFILIYVATMYLNQKVAIPESCKQAYLEVQSCESCATRGSKTSCSVTNTLEFLKEVKL